MKKTIERSARIAFFAPLIVASIMCLGSAKGQPAPGNKKTSPFFRARQLAESATLTQPRNIILMIGDGMGASQIYAGMVAGRQELNLERFRHLGFSKTYAFDDLITDSGAGATAFSIGKKAFNGAIGVDSDTMACETILETAARMGKKTGLVATSSITHATPASFVAHVPDREMHEEIARQITGSRVDLLIGAGKKYFEQRKDGRALTANMRERGFYTVFDSITLTQIPKGNRLAALLWDIDAPKMSEGRGDFLPNATRLAIDHLNDTAKGFFLMVEGSQIDWGGHANDADYIVQEMLDFDRAIGAALDFAQRDGQTLVVVTADHETGGFAINGGDMASGRIEGAFTTKKHTGVMVPVFAYGPGAHAFTGIQDNTSMYKHMMKLWGYKANAPWPWRNSAPEQPRRSDVVR
ncbi:MAG: alkaline phosphatase [Bacteroidia bacterium]